ncbi:2-amino-4-hydroxy-6-hydroxymethyldihydropteridine diphosphokinase [Alteromonas marina]|uniref:2-amino-4-hydroxy-6- hydroxymethyldihydropteridine diphosphokinase n=1 Tax=unclassified Alteromonas TaxID=2614992 RepID=UPI0009099248|nr:2-amino-4-hydroxy-6-hydroxymethyldihydropteridine diphosphokinase [Alteromonas sp. KUL150]APD85133.1 2-amino-4-hydroxy-6-hydroxymethyldihydropteridine diphosphokinase [Alteromonas sp. Mex14]GFD74629.1 2-amino-4-hydroxy-6-hydroxymethyldihydropteridine diphosphokinase [Tenacibaculum sp. KUL113]GFD86431.1 2-amino-4-hydroxy-6-hydroxymethyldihydropteridine diphosphokinase [Alteromonas sp. KUL150]
MSSHTILISIGSNIEREHYTRRSLAALKHVFSDVTVSSVYESEAVGFNGNPFYNAAARATTSKSIEEVCATLKSIERENGRVHTDKKFCARTLDLDLLTYDSEITTTPVVLPREEICYNAFVLWPLAELVPNDIHPETQETYAQMWQNFDKQKQQLWPIDFTWS